MNMTCMDDKDDNISEKIKQMDAVNVVDRTEENFSDKRPEQLERQWLCIEIFKFQGLS